MHMTMTRCVCVWCVVGFSPYVLPCYKMPAFIVLCYWGLFARASGIFYLFPFWRRVLFHFFFFVVFFFSLCSYEHIHFFLALFSKLFSSWCFSLCEWRWLFARWLLPNERRKKIGTQRTNGTRSKRWRRRTKTEKNCLELCIIAYLSLRLIIVVIRRVFPLLLLLLWLLKVLLRYRSLMSWSIRLQSLTVALSSDRLLPRLLIQCLCSLLFLSRISRYFSSFCVAETKRQQSDW